ncbi:MAG: hypothetical protein F2813_00545 [Actinobacteria bacterium]|uniref:Unannotated protein n=1 Tax=freshwater metagenome TaxID=449393 RepID=A0A6J5Z1M2_9ZZZZ|nr:hypothetical protein [Actinomycetota bacterium]
MSSPGNNSQPICVLLLARELEQFILREQAEDLLRAPAVVAVDPPRIRYGAIARLPRTLADGLAARQAKRLLKTLRRDRGEPRVIVIFHPLQFPLARAMQSACPGCEIWYSRWDRYEMAYDAGAERRERLAELHTQAAEGSALTFAVSDALVEIEREAGREALLVTTPADSFPAPQIDGTVVAVSLGHLGWRTDWALLRAVAEKLGDRLVLLLIGDWHEDECSGDPDFHACRSHPSLVWLGRQSDEAASRLILTADVGIIPFKVEPFNDAGLPNRILKYARLGRRTVSPRLAGVTSWAEAVTLTDDADSFADALAEQAGARTRPDHELREWAVAQTARRQNGPLWERLEALGVARDS